MSCLGTNMNVPIEMLLCGEMDSLNLLMTMHKKRLNLLKILDMSRNTPTGLECYFISHNLFGPCLHMSFVNLFRGCIIPFKKFVPRKQTF